MAARAPTPYRINLKVGAPYRNQVDPRALRAAARAALAHQVALAPGELSLLVTGDDALRDLNARYLGQDHPTDVLSFPSHEVDPDSGRRYFGDIAISLPQARAQAARGHHGLRSELQLLVVHGVLHLLGHDHARRADKSRMWAAQASILAQLKAGITGPAAD